jgi:hypothetical protein
MTTPIEKLRKMECFKYSILPPIENIPWQLRERYLTLKAQVIEFMVDWISLNAEESGIKHRPQYGAYFRKIKKISTICRRRNRLF